MSDDRKQHNTNNEQSESAVECSVQQTRKMEGYSDKRHKVSAKHIRSLMEKTNNSAKSLADSLNDSSDSKDDGKDIVSSRHIQSIIQESEFTAEFQKTKNIGAKTIVALAEYFNVSTDYILGMTEYTNPDIELRELGKKIGLSDIAVNSLDNIVREGLVPALNMLLENGFMSFLLGDISRTRAYTDKVLELRESLQNPEKLHDFKTYVNYLSKRETKRVEETAEYYISSKPSLASFFEAFPIHAQVLCGTDYIEYMRQKSVERFSTIFADITDFDKAKKILEYGTDDEYTLALNYIHNIETSDEE